MSSRHREVVHGMASVVRSRVHQRTSQHGGAKQSAVLQPLPLPSWCLPPPFLSYLSLSSALSSVDRDECALTLCVCVVVAVARSKCGADNTHTQTHITSSAQSECVTSSSSVHRLYRPVPRLLKCSTLPEDRQQQTIDIDNVGILDVSTGRFSVSPSASL